MKAYPQYAQEKYAKFKVRGISYIFTAIYKIDLTPCSRVILEKLTVVNLIKKFPAFHGT
jgi:hypothetical protein